MGKNSKILFAHFILIVLFQLLQVSEIELNAQTKKKIHEKTTFATVPIQKIEEFKQDNSFKYIKQQPVVDFWGIILRWLSDFLKIAFSDQGVAPYVRYTVIILVFAFVISKLGGGNFSGIFTANLKPSNKNSFEYAKDNIHEINFEEEIKDAIKKQDFRIATRFLYLKLLKLLNKVDYIDWQPGKTNSSYYNELSNTNISNSFKKLSGLYEYSWYGHFELNQSEFELISKEYENTFLILNAH